MRLRLPLTDSVYRRLIHIWEAVESSSVSGSRIHICQRQLSGSRIPNPSAAAESESGTVCLGKGFPFHHHVPAGTLKLFCVILSPVHGCVRQQPSVADLSLFKITLWPWTLIRGPRIRDPGARILIPGPSILNPGPWNFSHLHSQQRRRRHRSRTLDPDAGSRIRVLGSGGLEPGSWKQDPEHRTQGRVLGNWPALFL